MDSSVPSRSEFYIMLSYSKIDQIRTKRELEKGTHQFKAMRDRVLAIGRKVK